MSTRAMITARIVLAIFGGYVLTIGLVGLGGLLLPKLGVAKGEAVLLSAMLGFLIYVGLVIWAFGEKRFWLVTAVLGAGSIGSVLLAAWLAPAAA